MTNQSKNNANTTINFKTALLASIGSGLEYYDFVIYIFLAQWLSKAFFPAYNHHVALLQTLGVFFLGAIARPLGSYFMGLYADKVGRRASYFKILLLMTIATLGIALCPSYASIGISATVLLIIFRLVQCICFGSDLPTGMILLAEHAPTHRKSFYCGLLIMNVAFGSAMGTGVSYLLLHYLSAAQMQAYGWRIGFLIGAGLNLIAFIARRQIKETNIYLKFKESLQAIKTFQINIKECLVAMGIIMFPASLVMLQTTFPMTLPTLYHIPSKTIFLYLTIFGLIEALFIPLFSWFSDLTPRRVYYRLAIIVWLLVMPLGFVFWLSHENNVYTILFLGCYTMLVGLLAGGFFILMAEVFSIRARVKQYAISYNIVYLIMAAVPLAVTWLMHHNSWLIGTLGLLILMAIISLLATCSKLLTHANIQKRWYNF